MFQKRVTGPRGGDAEQGLLDDLDADDGCEECRVLNDVGPGHPRALQRLRAADAGEVAAAELDPLETARRERRLA